MDLDVQIRAFVDRAMEEQADPVAWLTQMRNEAMDAVRAGDVEVTTVAYEGGSGSGASRFNAQMLLETVQLALEEVKGEGEVFRVLPNRSCQVILL